MSNKKIAALAQISGLVALPKGQPWGAPFVTGMVDGFPVTAAWVRRGNEAGLVILVRFKQATWVGGADQLFQVAGESAAFREALGKASLPNGLKRRFTMYDDGFDFFWTYSFFAPKPQEAWAALNALVGIASRCAKPIGKACESCGTEGGAELVLADGLPTSVCSPCRLRTDEAARRAEEEYLALDSNPMMGLLCGAGVAILLAMAWGGIAFAINRIFVYGAIGMGLAIAWAVNWGMGKVNGLGRVLTVLLTLGSVVLGDFFFLCFFNAKPTGLPLGLELARIVGREFLELNYSKGSGFLSLFFALIGAGYILYTNRSPVFRIRYEAIPPKGNA